MAVSESKSELEQMKDVAEAMELLKRNTKAAIWRRALVLSKQKRIEGLRRHYILHPEHRKRQGEIIKAYYKQNPDFRRRQSEHMIDLNRQRKQYQRKR